MRRNRGVKTHVNTRGGGKEKKELKHQIKKRNNKSAKLHAARYFAHNMGWWWDRSFTSFALCGAPGRVMRATPLHRTAVSSTKTHSGWSSSGGSSTTSTPSWRRRRHRASCCLRASSKSTSPRVRNDTGTLHTRACVYLNPPPAIAVRPRPVRLKHRNRF
jgi:hypothetical protein